MSALGRTKIVRVAVVFAHHCSIFSEQFVIFTSCNKIVKHAFNHCLIIVDAKFKGFTTCITTQSDNNSLSGKSYKSKQFESFRAVHFID
jgi:hypothetical protein